jgi:hypothetical protein
VNLNECGFAPSSAIKRFTCNLSFVQALRAFDVEPERLRLVQTSIPSVSEDPWSAHATEHAAASAEVRGALHVELPHGLIEHCCGG